MEEKILKQTLTTPAAMEASEPLPQARKLLPKPVESQAPPFQYNIVQNTPSERHLYIPLPTETLLCTTTQTRNQCLNLRCTTRGRGQPKQRQLRKRKQGELMFEKRHSTCVNTVNFQKTVAYGHGRYTGEMGVETFCPSVEGKKYPNKETWLEARKKENPPKKKKE